MGGWTFWRSEAFELAPGGHSQKLSQCLRRKICQNVMVFSWFRNHEKIVNDVCKFYSSKDVVNLMLKDIPSTELENIGNYIDIGIQILDLCFVRNLLNDSIWIIKFEFWHSLWKNPWTKAKQLSITKRKMKVRDNKNSQSDIFQNCFFIFHLDRKRKEVVWLQYLKPP